MDAKETLLQSIEERVTVYASWISQGGGIRSDASEDLYCGLLNTALEYKLQNMNWVMDNFPAIDLGDDEERLAVQVTSSGTVDKVRKTLRRFYDHKLNQRYNRLIVLIAGKAECGDGRFDHPGVELEIWGTAELMREFRKLPIKRLQKVKDFLVERVDAPQMQRPVLHLPLPTSLGVYGFLGRNEELRELQQAVDSNEKPILIWGLGGLGKTELAIRFGRQYDRGEVYWVTFEENFRETVSRKIAEGIPELLKSGSDPNAVYDKVMEHLRQCDRNDLLIIDNVDSEDNSFLGLQDDVYDELCNLPMHLILTTRYESPNGIEIKRMDNKTLYGIFERHRAEIETQEMDDLIRAVDGHTMMVDLIARTLHESCEDINPGMILEALVRNTLAQEDYPEVGTDRNRDRKQRQIYTHICALFTLGGITEAGENILRCATLLPQDGMDVQLFRKALPGIARVEFRNLEKRGWLRREEHRYAIHPVVRMVCREKLRPTDESCEDFLNALWEQYDKSTEIDENIPKYVQGADCFQEAYKYLPEKTYLWVLHAQELLDAVADAYSAHENGSLESEMTKDNATSKNRLLQDPQYILKFARSLGEISHIFGEKGDHTKELENQEKCLAILENLTTGYRYIEKTHGANP